MKSEEERVGMSEATATPVAKTSADFTVERLAALRELIPEAFSEGKLDVEKLRLALGDVVDERAERYSFGWAGKRDAIRLLQTPTNATLVPAKEESVNWDTTQNLFIEGDNLEVLKLLYKAYYGRVKMIYIDPPYNTGQDLVYADNFADPLSTYLQLVGDQDTQGNVLTSNSDSSGRYHSSWLTMMYPRLFLARQLLKDDGVIFVSIDDHEVHNLRLVMNEVFGEENFLAAFVWKRRSGAMDSVNNVSTDHEYVLSYGRSVINLTGVARTFERYENPDNDPRGPWVADNLSAAKPGGNTYYPVCDPSTGYEYWPPKGRYWPYSPSTMQQKIDEGRIIFSGRKEGPPLLKRFKNEAKSLFRPVSSWITSPSDAESSENPEVSVLSANINTEGTREIKALFEDKVFTYPKPVSLLRSLIEQGTSGDDDIILDFFSGSSTTAQAVLEQNLADNNHRRFIMVQLPEFTPQESSAWSNGYKTIAEIGKERIRRVIARMRQELSKATKDDLDLGFKVFKLGRSNFPSWNGLQSPDFDTYISQLSLFTESVQSGADPLKMVYEIAIHEGFGLHLLIELVHVSKNTDIYIVKDQETNQLCYISLSDSISFEIIQSLQFNRNITFICPDASLSDDLAANLALQCHLKTF